MFWLPVMLKPSLIVTSNDPELYQSRPVSHAECVVCTSAAVVRNGASDAIEHKLICSILGHLWKCPEWLACHAMLASAELIQYFVFIFFHGGLNKK